jgi:hypothetical protein
MSGVTRASRGSRKMDKSIDQRIARIVAARQARAAIDNIDQTHDRERRAVRSHVLDELPRFKAKLSDAIAELNDRLDEEHIRLQLDERRHSPVVEAIFVIVIDDRDTDYAENSILSINIDNHGKANFLIAKGDARSLIKSDSIFEIAPTILIDLLVHFLEIKYNPNF